MENEITKIVHEIYEIYFWKFLTGDETCVYNFSQNIWSLTESMYQRMQKVLSIAER